MKPHEIEAELKRKAVGVQTSVTALRRMIQERHPWLQELYKWNCVMWSNQDRLVLGVAPLAKGVKVCFFEDPDSAMEFDSVQRWGSSHTSRNLTFEPPESLDLDAIDRLVSKLQKTAR
jgi:hypothetical protein